MAWEKSADWKDAITGESAGSNLLPWGLGKFSVEFPANQENELLASVTYPKQ